jgi:hypothetical protein
MRHLGRAFSGKIPEQGKNPFFLEALKVSRESDTIVVLHKTFDIACLRVVGWQYQMREKFLASP